MSQAITPDLLGPTRWVHMATVMTDSLQEMIAHRRAEPSLIPVGIRNSARAFFETALQAIDGRVPDDPPQSVANYRMAAQALRASDESAASDRASLEGEIKRCYETIPIVETPKDLNSEEVEALQGLAEFFKALATSGKIERYDEYMRST